MPGSLIIGPAQPAMAFLRIQMVSCLRRGSAVRVIACVEAPQCRGPLWTSNLIYRRRYSGAARNRSPLAGSPCRDGVSGAPISRSFQVWRSDAARCSAVDQQGADEAHGAHRENSTTGHRLHAPVAWCRPLPDQPFFGGRFESRVRPPQAPARAAARRARCRRSLPRGSPPFPSVRAHRTEVSAPLRTGRTAGACPVQSRPV